MKEERTLINYRAAAVPPLRWSAIFGGTFFAFGIMMILALFGVAVGSVIASPEGVTGGTKIWAGIWSLVTAFVGFLAGGWLAAKTSGSLTNAMGRLHAVVTWGLGSAAILYFAVNSTTRLATALSYVTGMAGQVSATPGTVESMTMTTAVWSLITVILGLIGALVGGNTGSVRRAEVVEEPDIRRAV